MKKLFYVLGSLFYLSTQAQSQPLCFVDPNTGPLYHNGSSDGIYDIATGDFNNDGHQDIVTANATANSISFIAGAGNGTLAAADTFPVPGTAFAICALDYNGDGNTDVAVILNGIIVIMQGHGNGQFSNSGGYPGIVFPSRIYAEDLNNDARPDIIGCAENGLSVMINQGNGMFSAQQQYLAGYNVIDLTVRDFDNDSINDIVSTTRTSLTTAVLSFLKGNGDGTFNVSSSYPVPHYGIFGICSNDFDGDGNFDVVVSNASSLLNRLELYRGKGDGTFLAPAFYPSYIKPLYLYLRDINKDGVSDIVAVESSGFAIFTGQAGGTLSPYQYFAATPSPNGLAIADYNGDAKPDVIVPSAYFQLGVISVNLNCTSLGIGAPKEADRLAIFPNPATDKVGVANTEAGAEIRLVNAEGKTLRTQICYGEFTNLDLREWPSGVYMLIYTYKGASSKSNFLKF